MSLFSLKEWWSTRVSSSEEFDDRHLVITNIDNQPEEKPDQNKIIVGSFSGILRIFTPHRRDFRTEDMVFENNFEEPIVQIEKGFLQPLLTQVALCVLFFKKVAVYQFVASNTGI